MSASDSIIPALPISDGSRLLPAELWRLIFSHLSDYQICTSVIPVCRHFREVALSVVFRRLNHDGAINLGRDWMQWYNGLPTQLLNRAGFMPKSLEFSLSRELNSLHNDTSIDFQIGRFRESSGELRSDALSLEEGRKMIETIAEMPKIQRLKIQHRSFEKFERPPSVSSSSPSSSDSERVTTRQTAARQRTCAMAVGEFVEGLLTPCRDHLKELEFRLRCGCPRSFRRRQTDSSHSDYTEPKLGLDQIQPLLNCASLTSLTLHNCLSNESLSSIARAFPFLEKLHLSDCSQWGSSQLADLGALITGENLCLQLKSLRLEGFNGFFMPPSAIDNFFGTNVELSRRLLSLSIEYSIYQPDEEVEGQDHFELNQVFRACENLESLRLHVCLLPGTTDFSKLRKLKSLRYIQPGWIANHPELSISAPEQPNVSPTTLFSQLPSLVDLTTRLYDLPHPAYSPDYFRRCFSQLQSLNLVDTDRTLSDQFVIRILSACRKSLRRLVMGRVRDPKPLTEVDDADFQFTHLDVSEGGEVVFQMLTTPNLQHLVKFSYLVDDLPYQVQFADAATVKFIELACEASAHSLRHVEISCNFPVDKIGFVSKLKKVEILRVAVFSRDRDPMRVFPNFVAKCNRLFPVDRHDKVTGICHDGLDSFPALKELEVSLSLPNYPTGHPDFSYTIRKTCFGQIKRFLSFIAGPVGFVRRNQYIQLDPLDLVNDVVPEVPFRVRIN